MEFGTRTDRGRVRENNEDSLRVAPELGLFILSDGMGGQASGEVASRLVAETILSHCREAEANPRLPLSGERLPGVSEASNRLVSAIRVANHAVRQAAERNPDLHGMGATVVALWLSGARMNLAHVGDSRAYRLRRGALEQLTKDHSFVAEQVRRGTMTAQEASQSKLGNVLVRALGADREVDVDLDEQLVLEGDTLLLCSDGLTRELPDARIAEILGASEHAQEAADQLVDLANEAGGEDNISAIVVSFVPRLAGTFARIGRWLKGHESSSSQGGP
jgi:protein phosphatase